MMVAAKIECLFLRFIYGFIAEIIDDVNLK